MDLKVGDSLPPCGPGVIAYRKTAEDADMEVVGGAKKKKNKSNKENTTANAGGQDNASGGKLGSGKGKPKYVPLFDKDGKAQDVVLLPGRHPCECLAVKHALVNNCLACGRIVCTQEGSGPCFFCGRLVCTKEEQEVLDRKSRKSEALYKKLAGDSRAQYKDLSSAEQAHEKAINAKNKLLEFDISCEKRTKVIDDESDYFNIDANKWLTPEQRAALAKKKEELHEDRHKSRRELKVNFDFAGRRIVEAEEAPSYNFEDDKEMLALFKNDQFSVEAEMERRRQLEMLGQGGSDGGSLVRPELTETRPMYLDGLDYVGKMGPKGELTNGAALKSKGKLQDSQLQEMGDQGVCLSMHQPWASLLVMGAKIHEGRTWYSSHRGRLWIHAASKPPTQEEIDQLQNFYTLHSGIKAYQYPPHYPTSCLLGCVDVENVLPQEEYRELYPDGESSSPYVFVCKNPQELLIKFPMNGKHKLFKLDPNIHKAAQKSVKKTPQERGTGVMGL